MVTEMLEFARPMAVLGLNPASFALALCLVRLSSGRAQAVLIVINLWLFMELASTLMTPGYRFGDLLAPRLAASALQLAIAHALLQWWRLRRSGGQSVAAD